MTKIRSPHTPLLLVAAVLAASCSRSTAPPTSGSLQVTIAGLPSIATPSVTLGGNLLQENRCPYYRGPWHCYRPGGMHCYARHGFHREHAIFGGDRCYVVTPSDVPVSQAVYSASSSNVTVVGAADPVVDSVAYAPKTSFLSYISDPGDYIGAGQTADIAFGDATWSDQFNVSAGVQQLGLSVISTAGYSGFWWYIHFAAPRGQTLAVGSYPLATRWPFQAPTAPGFDFSGSGRGCNMSSGQFEILSISIAADSSINWFHAKFEQHCENLTPALKGEVVVVANPWR